MNSVQTPASHETPCQPHASVVQRAAPEHGVPGDGHGTGIGAHIQVTGIGGGAAPPQYVGWLHAHEPSG